MFIFIFFNCPGKWQEIEEKKKFGLHANQVFLLGLFFCPDISRSTRGYMVVCEYYRNAFGCFTEPVASSSWK